MINGNVTVTVVEIRGDKVRLGIIAPADVNVDRLEIHNAKHQENILNVPRTT